MVSPDRHWFSVFILRFPWNSLHYMDWYEWNMKRSRQALAPFNQADYSLLFNSVFRPLLQLILLDIFSRVSSVTNWTEQFILSALGESSLWSKTMHSAESMYIRHYYQGSPIDGAQQIPYTIIRVCASGISESNALHVRMTDQNIRRASSEKTALTYVHSVLLSRKVKDKNIPGYTKLQL